jgi:hypothetical protein
MPVMSTRRIEVFLVLSATGVLAGCASASGPRFAGGSGPEEPTPSVSFDKGAVILTGAALTDGAGSLLATMSGKIPNFHVHRIAGDCPQITLRNVGNMSGAVSPHVYVDGTRATDTCVLESLRSNDVERVEVYPQGFTTRPGYGRHGPGLILVFIRSS